MADSTGAIAKIIKNEKGYVNDPADTGGETYNGIARKKNPTWAGWKVIDAMRPHGAFTNAAFAKVLDANAALQKAISTFYKSEYWDKVRGDEIKSQAAADSLSDAAVNMGCHQAILLAQRALGFKDPKGTVPLDDKTLAAINNLGEKFKV